MNNVLRAFVQYATAGGDRIKIDFRASRSHGAGTLSVNYNP